jgi:hypothetical protein
MNNKLRFNFVMIFLALLLGGVNQSVVQARGATNKYGYLVGKSNSTIRLCRLGPSACPDIAMAPDGQFIEISGMGTLNTRSMSVTGGGNYTHHFLEGFTVNGIWTATKLLRFSAYECEYRKTLGLVCGGEALIQVHIVADGGLFEGDGILQVDSVIDGSPSGATEGVLLDVPGVVTFDKKVSGKAVFYPLH